MSFRAPFIVFALVVLFLSLGTAAFDAANSDAKRGAGDETRVVNESFSGATTGYEVAVGDDNTTYSASHEVVVRDGGGNELSSQNYRWNENNGTLTTASTGSGTIDYSAYEPSATTSGVLTMVSLPQAMGGSFIWLFFAFVVIGALILLVKVVT